MKRLSWLLLTLFCTFAVQVQAVDGLNAKAKSCCCCCHPGACGMPGCCPPASSGPTALNSQQATKLASSQTERKRQAVRGLVEKFYVRFVEVADLNSAQGASAEAAPSAIVPLYKAHCSFLI